MADEIKTGQPSPTAADASSPAVVSQAAPVDAATPAASPAITPAAVDAAPSSTAAQPSVQTEDKSAQPQPEIKADNAPKAAETILGAEPPKEEVKKDEKAPDAKKTEEVKADGTEPKKEDGNQSVEPAPLPTYEAFKLPEGVNLDNERLGEFTKELAELETSTKADHAKMQEFGQKLVDRHVAEVQETVKRLNEHYTNAWEKQKLDWKEQFVKDPEIGGNRQETTVNSALEFIRTHGGSEAQQQELRQLFETTGIGNHPAIIRTFAKAMTAMREGKPLPASKPESTATNKVTKRYGETK